MTQEFYEENDSFYYDEEDDESYYDYHYEKECLENSTYSPEELEMYFGADCESGYIDDSGSPMYDMD